MSWEIEVPSKVDELRSALLEMGEPEARVARLSKAELKSLFISKKQNEFSELKSALKSGSENNEPELLSMQDAVPKYGTIEWQDYVLSQFRPDELSDGYPRCVGLRRVAQLLLGPIVSAKCAHLSVVPTDSSRAVTVSYEVTFDWTLDQPIVVDIYANHTPNLRTFGGVADCIEAPNLVYGRHPAASAETKAASRAFKTALGINVISAEEKVSGYDDTPEVLPSSSKINKPLKQAIEAKLNILKIDLNRVLKEFGRGSSLDDFSMDDGRKLFEFINTYQQV